MDLININATLIEIRNILNEVKVLNIEGVRQNIKCLNEVREELKNFKEDLK